MTELQWMFVVLIVVPTTAWIALAVHYHIRRPWLRPLGSMVPLAAVGVSLWLWPLYPWALAVWFGLMVVAFAWWFSLRPRSDRDWAIGLESLPRVELVGDTVSIRQFRNFGYSESGDALPRYEERSFDLSRLASVDYFLSHWSGPLMAHTLVSFGFDDGQFLAVSIEARRERWQSYSPLWGLFRSYELMFVLGDERDIVRLRTNVRRERVYLYRVRMSPQNLRQLLVDYLAKAEMLAAQPQWYNSITSNCTTNLFYHGRHRAAWWQRPGIFLNGLSARTMYRVGVLGGGLTYKKLQAHSAVGELALAAGDSADFSQRIRGPQMVLPRPWSEHG